MENVISAWPEPKTDEEYQAAIKLMFAEMQRLNQQIQDDQAEIERLQAETRSLHRETEAIKARTQIRLDALQAMMLV